MKIGVGANADGVANAINKITAAMNKMGSAVAQNQKLKFEPVGVKLMERDLALINKQFQQALALSSQLRNALKATGQGGAHISQVDFSKLSTNPAAAQRMRDRAFLHSVRGTALDPTLANEVDDRGNIVPPTPPGGGAGSGGAGPGGGGGAPRAPRGGGSGGAGGGGGGPGGGGANGGSWWRRRPQNMGTAAALAIGGGIGGGAGSILTAGIAGGPIGAALAGVTQAIGAAMQFASEGIDLAKQQNESADRLKRSMGDLGISFKQLTDESKLFGLGIGVAGTEFLKLESQANEASGGAYRTPGELAEATRSGGAIGRAYGLDPSQGVNFVSGMQRLNARQNNKDLAAQLAEAIVNTQGKALPSEVMQAMMGFAGAQARFNGGSVDLNRLGNAYSSLLGTDGMTADHASSILGTANSAMEHMGGSEAAQNLTMRAFGNLDPIRARIRSEGGLFGNGLDDRNIASYMYSRGMRGWESMSKGPAGTNFSVINSQLDSDYKGNPLMEIDAQKNYWHLQSYADTAKFVGMSDSDHNGLMNTLKNAGVDLKDLHEGSVASVSSIAQAGSFGDLKSLYDNDISKRSDLTDSDRSALSKAEGSGDIQTFKNELVRVLAGKGQADDDASVQRTIDANIADMKTQIGEKLIPFTQSIMQGVLSIANKFGAGIQDPTTEGGSMFVGPSQAAAGNVVADLGIAGKITRPGDSSNGGAGGWWSRTKGHIASLSANSDQNVQKALAYFQSLGYTQEQAAGLVANQYTESGMDASASGDNGNAYGIGQWHMDRQANFKQVFGHDIHRSTLDEQLKFTQWELTHSEKAAGDSLRRSKTADQAGWAVSQDYERPADALGQARQRAELAANLVGSGADKLNDSDIRIVDLPPSKIPAKYQEKSDAAAGQTTATGMASPIVIQLDQTIQSQGPNGQTKMKKINTSLSVPSSSGNAKATLAGN
ncbi:phage tail tip lysozyme [Paraburkholderia haematera]|uniref:phage tail tip lysozyme n=1 Tax=Paraburkholderia haematera TaxID=2793077 RepID=UPI0022A8903C|nr:phage tail tip lysozyme [Paraburkholderia haematera]